MQRRNNINVANVKAFAPMIYIMLITYFIQFNLVFCYALFGGNPSNNFFFFFIWSIDLYKYGLLKKNFKGLILFCIPYMYFGIWYTASSGNTWRCASTWLINLLYLEFWPQYSPTTLEKLLWDKKTLKIG